MAEKQTQPNLLKPQETTVFDWSARLVLERVTPEGAVLTSPFSDKDTHFLNRSIAHRTMDDVSNIRTVWDDLTDKLLIDCQVSAQDQPEATKRALEPVFWTLRHTGALFGHLDIYNMQVASNADLSLAEGGDNEQAITDEVFDVTIPAKLLVAELTLFSRLFPDS